MSLPSPSQIFVRAYTEKPGAVPVGSKMKFGGNDVPSPWTLTFDCETSIDAAQHLRIGTFQVRHYETLKHQGIFCEPSSLDEADITIVKEYALRRGLEVRTVEDFRINIFLRYGYYRNGTVVGFNLPFDLSRIAIEHGPARGAMRGGFTFELTSDTREPHVRVKHLGPRSALIDFAAPAKQDTPRGMRKRGHKVRPHRGFFIDIKTLAAALTSGSFSLASLARFLRTPTQKLATDEHGGPITDRYLDYALADVQATWECHEELVLRYAKHGLDTSAHRILSEASIGKGYLKQMGIMPLLGYQPGIPRSIFGKIIASYFGGRAEVRIRRVPTQVLYCDFKSMYPTVSALMGLWPFVIGRNLTWHDTTEATQALLDRVTLQEFQDRDTWRSLRTLVRLRPGHDILPVRAKYDGKVNTIGLNHLTSDQSLWYTLADCVASKILSGKTPKIDEALTFEPGPPQASLETFSLFERADFSLNPYTDDLFARLIDLRDDARAKGDPVEKALKIVANSTGYGIFVEVNRDDAPKPEPLDVFGPDGEAFRIESTAIEEPGRYFHPLLGTLITGAARLMLALAEQLTADQGLDWVFCDTDSIAIAKPAGMENAKFHAKASRVIDWFEPLNPYRKTGSILKIEDANYGIGSGEPEPLYCLAISAKRYVLFNLDTIGRPVIRKASAHGLGHLMEPYGEHEAPTDIPSPSMPLADMGVKRWQYDLWFKIIEATLGGHPERVALDYHPALQRPAISRYSATSPKLLKWMDRWNESKTYATQVKPFGFLVSFMVRTGAFATGIESEIVDPTQRGRPTKPTKPKPIAPFERDHELAVQQAFDRDTGEPIEPRMLKTYAEALAQFHLSTEDKFENGDFCDTGKTERRHIVVRSVGLIGKEANKVDADGHAHPTSPATSILRAAE